VYILKSYHKSTILYIKDMNSQRRLLLCIIITILFTSIHAKSQYKVINTIRNTSTLTLTLNYTGSDNYFIKETSPIIKKLTFTFHTHTFFDFLFKITDPNNKRFEWPQYGVFPIDPEGNFSFPTSNSAVSFEYTE